MCESDDATHCNDGDEALSLQYQHVWSVGEECRGQWSGDKKYYNGVIRQFRRLEGGRVLALVKFCSYDSDETEEIDIQHLQQVQNAGHRSPEKDFKRDQGEGSRQEADKGRQEADKGLFAPLTGDENQAWLQEKYGDASSSNSQPDHLPCVQLPRSPHSTMGRVSDWLISTPDKRQAACHRKRSAVAVVGSPKKKHVCEKAASTNYRNISHRKPAAVWAKHSCKKEQSSKICKTAGNKTRESATLVSCHEGGVQTSKRSQTAENSKEAVVVDPHLADAAAVDEFAGFEECDLEKPKFNFPAAGPKVPFYLNDKLKVPAPLNQYLRDYQREGVHFLYSHFQHGRGAILADDMGLGKTVQVIGLLSALLAKEGNRVDIMCQKPHFIRKMSETKVQDSTQSCRPFLIVSPGSVLYNWMEELDAWGYFAVRKYHGNEKASCLQDIAQSKAEVVVTTFETLRDNFDSLNAVEWQAVIVDEVHKIKGLKAQTTQALKNLVCLRRYGLTGTALQNSMLELWCLLDWAQPGVLGSAEMFENTVVKVIELGQKLNATKRELAEARKKKEEFSQVRRQMLLRRTKHLIADQLPKKTDQVVFCPLTPVQVDVYQAVLAHPDVKLVLNMDDPCTCGSGRTQGSCCWKKIRRHGREHSIRSLTLSYLHVLLKAANHAALLIPHSKADPEQARRLQEMCQIAFRHHPEFVSQSREAAFRTLSDPKYCGKMKVLQGMLSVFMKSRSKVLVFSYSTRLLDIVEQHIMSKGQEYRRIDGTLTGRRRQEIVHEFNRDPNIFLCLVSTKAGGLGLNLTGANKVVIFDPNWNPSHDLQAQDRAYRIGQRRDVEVYRLISVGTIEENIYLRQVYKQQLDNVAIASENARRYFLGIHRDKQNRGELFGVKNMFAFRTGESCLTLDILQRNASVEARIAGHKVVEYVPSLREQEAAKRENCDEDSSQEIDEAENTCSSKDSADIFKEMFDLDEELCSASPHQHPKLESETQRGSSQKKKTAAGCLGPSESEACCSEGETKETRDSLITPSFSSVSSVFDNFKVVHVHDNPHIVGASRVEDHMSRCAMQDVYELHTNTQAPALLCDPLHQDKMQPVNKTPTKPHGSRRGTVGTTPEKDHNSPRTLNLGTLHILVGQTPPALRRRQWVQLRDMLDLTDSVALAERVLRASTKQRLVMLSNLVLETHGDAVHAVLKDTLTASSQPAVDGDGKDAARRVASTPAKGKAKHQVTARKRQGQKSQAREVKQDLDGTGSSWSLRKHAVTSDNSPSTSPDLGIVAMVTAKTSGVRASRTKVTPKRARTAWKKETFERRGKTLSKRRVSVTVSARDAEDGGSDGKDRELFSVEQEDMEVLLHEMGQKSNSSHCEGEADHTSIKDRNSFHKHGNTVESKSCANCLAATRKHQVPHTSLLDEIFCDSDAEAKDLRKPPPLKAGQRAAREEKAAERTKSSWPAADRGQKMRTDCSAGENKQDADRTERTDSPSIFLDLNSSTLCDDGTDCVGKASQWKKKTRMRKLPVAKVDRLLQETSSRFRALFDSRKLVREKNTETAGDQTECSAGRKRESSSKTDASHSLFS